jgi:plasmid maintenance system antidote protein VapI
MIPQARRTLAESIKEAVRNTGKSVNAVANASGVSQPVLQRFVSGKRSLALNTAERLCAYLGLELQVGTHDAERPS